MKKYFGEFDMTWPKVIIFAVMTDVLTAVLNLIPALHDSSFQDVAISYECRILFWFVLTLLTLPGAVAFMQKVRAIPLSPLKMSME